MKNLIKIIKEEIDHFEWAKGEIDLKGYVLNFEPAVDPSDFKLLIERLNELGIYEFGNGFTLQYGLIHGSNTFLYQAKGVHYIFVKNDGRIMGSSGPLSRTADYMMDSEHNWNPTNLLDGHEVLNM